MASTDHNIPVPGEGMLAMPRTAGFFVNGLFQMQSSGRRQFHHAA